MKIATNVYSTAPTGGVELNAFQMGRALAGRGHAVHLLYEELGSLEPEYQEFCASVTQVTKVDYWYPGSRKVRPKRMAEMVPAIWAAVRQRPDVLYGQRSYSTGWTIAAGRLLGKPVVCHLHGHTDMRPEVIAFLNRHVDRFVPVSHWVADQWAASGLDPAKITVVHNAIDPAEYPVGGIDERTVARRALDLPDDAFVVCYLGRLDAEKGVDVLLKAWNRLGLGADRARLVLVGSSVTDRDGGAFVAEMERMAEGGVTFLGNRRDVVTPLHAADVVVVPSMWDEAFGRVVIEAMATGRPVLGTRSGGIPEILTGPFERFLSDRGDVDQLVDRLRSLLRWRDEEPELAAACTAHIQELFRLELALDRMEAILSSPTT